MIENKEAFSKWWDDLSPLWKKAINGGFLNKGEVEDLPNSEEIQDISTSPALRLVGPTGIHPNLSFELTDLSGLTAFKSLETVIITYHQIEDIEELSQASKLTSLFIHNNILSNIDILAELTLLENLYIHSNQIESIQGFENLSNLRAVTCEHNNIKDISIFTKSAHPRLEQLRVTPNPNLSIALIDEKSKELNIRIK